MNKIPGIDFPTDKNKEETKNYHLYEIIEKPHIIIMNMWKDYFIKNNCMGLMNQYVKNLTNISKKGKVIIESSNQEQIYSDDDWVLINNSGYNWNRCEIIEYRYLKKIT